MESASLPLANMERIREQLESRAAVDWLKSHSLCENHDQSQQNHQLIQGVFDIGSWSRTFLAHLNQLQFKHEADPSCFKKYLKYLA